MIRFRFSFTFPALKSFCTTCALVLSCIFLSAAANAQGDQDDVLKVNTALVQLNVGVVDKQGRAITNLSRNDFSVYEDDVLQSITDFEPTAAPFSLVLLLDMSGSTQTFRPTLKQAAYRFLDALGPDDRVAVIAFNDKVKTLANFTTDRKKVGKSIEYAEGKGETHFYEALRFALEQLAKEGKRRKAIIVLTDGIDTDLRKQDRDSAASAHTNEEALASVKPNASGALNSVLSLADRQGVTIYPLALPSGDPKRLPFVEPVQAAIYGSARVRLQTLADRTGGRLNDIKRLEDMGTLYAGIAADLRTLYTVFYSPKNTNAQTGRWRAIRIEVSHTELIAHTRPGYFGR
ncbi:MAG: Ca-activated chloride channel [Acidobacteriota bacterium]|jgi:VWFA-related protein|nr:Ca-activated chloride channel [Acidobacteriota bacterium]